MKKLLPIFLLLAIITQDCEKENLYGEYPTTIHKLSTDQLSRLRSNYISCNPYINSSLNDFGFCDLDGDPLNNGMPPYAGEITSSAAEENIKTFVSGNIEETGVNHPEDLSFTYSSNDTGYDGNDLWHFRSAHQYLDTIEVLNTQIIFHLTNGMVTSCYGNWYPVILIPEPFNVSATEAKASLEEKIVSHYTIAGVEYTVTIKKEDLDSSTVHVKIVPVENEDNIALHVCWEINIPGPVSYIIYVDVMTGSVVREEPTIIS